VQPRGAVGQVDRLPAALRRNEELVAAAEDLAAVGEGREDIRDLPSLDEPPHAALRERHPGALQPRRHTQRDAD
jgi:hypothetical protein